MEFILIYAIIIDSLLTLFLIRIAPSFLNILRLLSFLITKHLIYLYLQGRYKLISPYTRANILLYIIYIVINVFFIAFNTLSITVARDHARTLSMINISILFLAHYLGLLIDTISVSLITYKRIYRAIGQITVILLILYIIIALIAKQKGQSLREKSNLFTFIIYPLSLAYRV